MSAWPADDLNRIAASHELRVAPLATDGKTHRTPTRIWSVVVDDRLFARAWNGTDSRWYRSAVSQRTGQASAAGSTVEVEFAPVSDAALSDRIDAAYRHKYAGSPYLPPMVAAGPRSATVEITPRSTP